MRSLAALSALLALTPVVYAQIDFEDGIHNATAIWGTWSSGPNQAGNVRTGGDFCNPVTSQFTYPPTAGISYSFTQDGWFEEALYRFVSNGTDHRCIKGLIQWQHGKYELTEDGQIILEPIPEDGRQIIQDPCAAESATLRQLNQTTTFVQWRIFEDRQYGPKLHLFQFDGAPLSPMFLASEEPDMLPLRQLTNTTLGAVAPTVDRRSLRKRSAAVSNTPSLGGAAVIVSATVLSVVALL